MAMLNGNVEYKQTAEYRDAVARSEKRSSDHRRLSQQIWQQSRQLSKARALFRKAEIGLWDALTQEEQDLVEAYGGGHLERELQHLVSQKAPIYRGVATSVSDPQRCQRGLLTRACTSDLCLEQRSVGEGRRATAACIGWSAPWWSAPWCLRRGVCAVVAACIGWSAYWMVTRTQGQCMNNAEGNEIKVT